MEGWSLFYCKGPNGEQIEFNQVTRKVKKSFQKAVETYNQSNGTSLTFPGESVSQISQISQISQNIQGNNIVPNGDKTSTSKETVTRNNTETEKKSGRNIDLVKRLFSREEAFDSEGFITLFTDTAVYQFGNFDVCLDKQSIKKSADKFFSQIDAVHHEIKMMSEVEDLVFVEMDVFYWRKDGSSISLPCTGIFRVEGDKFSELRIFMDINPVFDPTISVPKSASVMTVSQGNIDQPPDTMRKHFGEYTEAKQRIAERYVTKWSISGSRWSIESETQAQPSKIQAVGELARAIMAQDWDKVKNLFRSDIFYKVGFSQARYGLQVVVDFFKDTFKNIAVFTGHQVGKVW
jgi:limonene-1,2-epoxide hydrolase